MHKLTVFPEMEVSQRKGYVLLHIVCNVVLLIFTNFLYLKRAVRNLRGCGKIPGIFVFSGLSIKRVMLQYSCTGSRSLKIFCKQYLNG